MGNIDWQAVKKSLGVSLAARTITTNVAGNETAPRRERSARPPPLGPVAVSCYEALWDGSEPSEPTLQPLFSGIPEVLYLIPKKVGK